MGNKEQKPDSDAKTRDAAPAVIDARDLFGEHRQLAITHNGVTYYLRITGNNKLILTK